MFEQPKEIVEASSARKGTCAVCGAKNVLVTHPPLSRHVDMKECDAQRRRNVLNRAVHVNVGVTVLSLPSLKITERKR